MPHLTPAPQVEHGSLEADQLLLTLEQALVELLGIRQLLRGSNHAA